MLLNQIENLASNTLHIVQFLDLRVIWIFNFNVYEHFIACQVKDLI